MLPVKVTTMLVASAGRLTPSLSHMDLRNFTFLDGMMTDFSQLSLQSTRSRRGSKSVTSSSRTCELFLATKMSSMWPQTYGVRWAIHLVIAFRCCYITYGEIESPIGSLLK